jgi:putative endonuclease
MTLSENDSRRVKGLYGESLAEEFLLSKGFEIVTRNFRASRRGEIDLIVKNTEYLVFVEVKNRLSKAFGGGIFSINAGKKRRLRASATCFLSRNYPMYSSLTCRFDLISIENGDITWLTDIFRG